MVSPFYHVSHASLILEASPDQIQRYHEGYLQGFGGGFHSTIEEPKPVKNVFSFGFDALF